LSPSIPVSYEPRACWPRAAPATDPDAKRHAGKVLVAADLAPEYGFTDVDGRQPVPLTLETA
jgi:hypothetical protein